MKKPSPLSREFGKALRAARLDRGLTQEAFCAVAGLRQHHLSKLETGHRLPEWKTMRRIRKVLGNEKALELLL